MDYDPLCDVYADWAGADPACGPTLRFYARLYASARGIPVELGVGDGRIALAALRAAEELRCIGVDVSREMIARCRRNAAELGLAHRIELLAQDVRELSLPRPAGLISFPFRSMGHVEGASDRRRVFEAVHANLEPGGRFVFDHSIWQAAWARAFRGVPCTRVDRRTAEGRLVLTETFDYDLDARRALGVVRIERFDPRGRGLSSSEHPFRFQWAEPSELAEHAARCGFEVEAVRGDFDGGALGPRSTQQVWFLRRSEAS
jgi:SAM-dependent methyltransferase